MSQSSRDSSREVAAQTASIGDQEMMTFLPNSASPSMAADVSVDDPLHRHFRGESMMTEDDIFDVASLDEFLKGNSESGDVSWTNHAESRRHSDSLTNYPTAGNVPPLPSNGMLAPSQPSFTGAPMTSPSTVGINYGNIGGGRTAMSFNGGMATHQNFSPQLLSFPIISQQQSLVSIPANLNGNTVSVATLPKSIVGAKARQIPQQTQQVPAPQINQVQFSGASFTHHPQQALPMNLAHWNLGFQHTMATTAHMPTIPRHQTTMTNNFDISRPQPSSVNSRKSPIISPPNAILSNITECKKRKNPTVEPSQALKPPGISEDESDRKKRRSERNMREQERSHRITDCIAELRSLLAEAGKHFKPDRYSTLVGVVEYIKTLQGRSRSLDEEHGRLMQTISGAGSLVNGGGSVVVQRHTADGENTSSRCSSSASTDDLNNDDELLVFARGIDYKFIFTSCGVALAITSVDGRFVDCNEEFLKLTGYDREELLGEPDDSDGPSGGGLVTVSTCPTPSTSSSKEPSVPKDSHDSCSSHRPPSEIRMVTKSHLSLFNLLGREDMETVYAAMSLMLRASPHPSSHSSDRHVVSSSSRSDVSSMERAKNTKTNHSSSSDSTTQSTSSSGNEILYGGSGITADHWSGRVKHTRRNEQMLQLNISLVREGDGRPKFFNCALSEVK